jgi:hypothetical protein
LIAAANPRVSSLRAFEPSYLPASASGIPTGLGSLDAELPWGGLPRGAVSQILGGEPGLGAMSLALAVAGRAARGDDVAGPGWIGRGGVEAESARPIVVIDPAGDFYPPAAVRFGLNPQRVLVVRPGRVLDAVWAAEQSLRCPAVAAVVARLERLGRVHSRRLQLAAEAGGGVGLVVTPLAGRERTFVAVAVALNGERRSDEAAKRGKADIPVSTRVPHPRLVRVTVLKVREGIPAEPFVVGLDDEAGFMPVHAVAEGGAAGAGRKRAGA